MEMNIKQKDCRFIVKPDDRMVICIIDGEWVRNAVTEFLYDLDDPNFDLSAYGKLRDQLRMPRAFVGKAVCAAEDEWNEETGKLLAFYRAKHKFYSSFFKRGTLYINSIDRAIDKIYDTFNNMGESLELNRLKLEMVLKDRGVPFKEE